MSQLVRSRLKLKSPRRNNMRQINLNLPLNRYYFLGMLVFFGVYNINVIRSVHSRLDPIFVTPILNIIEDNSNDPLEKHLWSWPTEVINWTSSNGSFGCQHELHLSETLWIAIPTWDDPERLNAALESVRVQERSGFQTIHVLVFEHESENTLSFQQQHSYTQNMNVTFLRGPLLPSSTYKMNPGSAYGKWILFDWIRKHALPHEYVFILGGDATLSSNDDLRYVHRTLSKQKPWFAWGQSNGQYNDRCKPLQLSSQGIRKSKWSFCHPRMFQSHLLHRLKKEDFQRDVGLWIQEDTDQPFIYKFMEMAGPERTILLHERVIYNYTTTSNNSSIISPQESITDGKELTFNRPPALQLPETIIVIACVYDRKNTKKFLQRLKASILDPKMELRIHICNNNYKRKMELANIAASLNRAQEAHVVTIHDMGANIGGLARFVLARKIMQEEFVSYVIMIDDDQYVIPNTIALIYARREPHTYKTWYGKNWDHSIGSTRLKYFKPHTGGYFDPSLSIDNKHISSWQYGGTGMSIIDAAIFKTQELFQIEPEFYFVEDMWLSYLVTLSGWPIKRLFLEFDDATEERTSGQWSPLVKIKENFFRKLEYFSCSSTVKVVPKTCFLKIFGFCPRYAFI